MPQNNNPSDRTSAQALIPLSKAEGYRVAENNEDVRGWDVRGNDGEKLGKVNRNGILLMVAAIRLFVTIGKGTLAPWNPTQKLVVHGVYRHVRNPMISGVMFILLGEFLLAASLPLFIPGPPYFIGTFGAIIRLRGPIVNRRALFDIGVSGPLAGFIAALVALVIGLNMSTVVDRAGTHGLQLGEPLLLQFMSWLVVGSIPPQADIVLHPVGFAAWFGLFVTSLNLIPIGQLDGGHVAYALWGSRQRTIAFAIVPVLIALGFVGWPGWWLWAFMAGLWGFGHPPVRDLHIPLGRKRIAVGWIAFAVFVLTFAPVPFSFH